MAFFPRARSFSSNSRFRLYFNARISSKCCRACVCQLCKSEKKNRFEVKRFNRFITLAINGEWCRWQTQQKALKMWKSRAFKCNASRSKQENSQHMDAVGTWLNIVFFSAAAGCCCQTISEARYVITAGEFCVFFLFLIWAKSAYVNILRTNSRVSLFYCHETPFFAENVRAQSRIN